MRSGRLAVKLVRLVEAVRRIELPRVKGVTYYSVHDVWVYQAVMDTRICPTCSVAERIDEFNGNALRINFPHHKILDVNTIEANVHPNCRCYLIRKIGHEEPVAPKKDERLLSKTKKKFGLD